MSVWRERLWKLLFFSALLLVTWLFLMPSPPSPGPSFPSSDKLQHVLVFAALALLAGRAYRDRPRLGIAFALVFYGACVEIAQSRTSRAFELLDIVADALGVAALWLAPRPRNAQR